MNNIDDEINAFLEKYGKIKLSEIPSEQIEAGNELISKLDLSKIVFGGGNVTRFDEIDNPIEMVRYLTSKEKINKLSEKYVSHYTNYETAQKIIDGKMFQLGNPANMNDGLEFNSPKMDCSKLYFASFSIEDGENIGMWSMYGQPWEDGIKISIPKKFFVSWAEKIQRVYNVDSETHNNIMDSPLSEEKFKASISRVAYVKWDDSGHVVQIRCGDAAHNERIKSVDSPMFTGLIKDIAWSYEKEIRLRVDLSSAISGKKVAVDIPDDVMKSIIITTGPRFNKSIGKEFGDISEVRTSIYNGKLNYVYCDTCRKNNKEKNVKNKKQV